MKRKFLAMTVCTTILISQGTIVSANAQTRDIKKNVDITYAKQSNKIDMIVDKSFTGEDGTESDGIKTYKTIKSALDSVSEKNTEEVVIFVKNGTYNEKLKVTKKNIVLVGESQEDTIISFGDSSGTIKRVEDGGDGTVTYGTTGSATLTVSSSAKGFSMVNITVENSYDEIKNATMENKQAVAMKNESNESIFINCSFIGNQDTLYANKNNQYYYNCYIEGDVDYILGAANAVFDNCEIFSVEREGIYNTGFIAAPSTLSSEKGFLIINSKLTSNVKKANSIYLGRPWHATSQNSEINSSVTYVNTEMGYHIAEKGWVEMNGHKPEDNRMYEYKSTGEGAIVSDSRRVLSDEEAKECTIDNFLSDWDKEKREEKVKELSLYLEDETEDDDTIDGEVPGDDVEIPGEDDSKEEETPGNDETDNENPDDDTTEDDVIVKLGWVKNSNGTWSLFENGQMVKGWKQVDETWYFMNNDGIMQTGWLLDKGTWYYLKSSGEMATGWIQVNGTWYYLKTSGAMATGWVLDNGNWYYLKDNGKMATSWLLDNGSWYYLKENGKMETGWILNNGSWYYLRSNGKMATGWIQDNNNWYYLYENGKMAYNVTIGGYKLGANGAWIR